MSTARITIPNSARRSPPVKRREPTVRVVRPEEPSTEPTTAESEAAAKRQLDELFQRVNQIAQEVHRLQELRSQDVSEMRELAIHVGMAAAERILSTQLDEGQEALTALVNQAIAAYQPQKPIRIHVHPSCVASIQASIPHADVQGDAALDPSDCSIEYDEFMLHRQWRAQLDEIGKLLLEGGLDAGAE